MSNLTDAVKLMSEPDKSLFELLIEFYTTMKQLEHDENREGKQATKIVMTVNDIQVIYKRLI